MFTSLNETVSDPALRLPGLMYWLVFVILLLAIAGTGLAVVYSTHASRHRLNSLQQLEQHRNFLQVEWGRLLLEQSSLVSQGKVEDMAIAELGMQAPDMSKVVVLNSD